MNMSTPTFNQSNTSKSNIVSQKVLVDIRIRLKVSIAIYQVNAIHSLYNYRSQAMVSYLSLETIYHSVREELNDEDKQRQQQVLLALDHYYATRQLLLPWLQCCFVLWPRSSYSQSLLLFSKQDGLDLIHSNEF